MKRALPIGLLLLGAGVGAAACAGPDHLSSDFGLRSHQYFEAQAILPPGRSVKPSAGLDPQEAGIVVEGYRRMLAPKGVTVDKPPLLYIAPSREKP